MVDPADPAPVGRDGPRMRPRLDPRGPRARAVGRARPGWPAGQRPRVDRRWRARGGPLPLHARPDSPQRRGGSSPILPPARAAGSGAQPPFVPDGATRVCGPRGREGGLREFLAGRSRDHVAPGERPPPAGAALEHDAHENRRIQAVSETPVTGGGPPLVSRGLRRVGEFLAAPAPRSHFKKVRDGGPGGPSARGARTPPDASPPRSASG